MALGTYSTGTVSVAANGTTVTCVGGSWSSLNARQGDFIKIGTYDPVLITNVVDTTHCNIPEWKGTTQSGVAYTIYHNYPGRVIGVAAAEDVQDMLDALLVKGLPIFIVEPGGTPDPSLGMEGQYAADPTMRDLWLKTGGVWVAQPSMMINGYIDPTFGGTLTGVNAHFTGNVTVDGLIFADDGLVGGALANSTLIISSTTSGAPSGDSIRLIGSTVRITGSLKLDGSSSGQGTLTPPTAASSYIWTLPAATTTLAGLDVAQNWTADQGFGLAFFSSGVVGGNLANSTLTLSSTNHGAPSGDNVHIVGSTIRLRGSVSVGANLAPDSLLTLNANTAASVTPPIGTALHVVAADGAAVLASVLDTFAATPAYYGRRAGGTLASKVAVGVNLTTVTMLGQAWDGAAYNSTGQIAIRTAQAQTSTLHGSYITFFTTATTASAALAEAVRIQPSGGLSIGATAIANDPGIGGLSIDGLGFFNLGVIGGTGAAATLTLASTTSGAPSGDTVRLIGSTVRVTGTLKLDGSSSGQGTLAAPAAASSYVWTFPAATTTLAGLSVAQNWTADQGFGLAFFSTGVVGGNLANSTLTLSSTNHGAPSGDNVHIYGSTITAHGNVSVTGRIDSAWDFGLITSASRSGTAGSASAQLQADINALIAAGGGILKLPDGIYDTTGTQIVVDLSAISTRFQGRIIIEGEGVTSIIRNTSGSCFKFLGSTTNVESYFELRNVRLAGGGAGGSIGLHLVNVAYARISNVIIEGFNLGIDATDVEQIIWESCNVRFNTGGIRINIAAFFTDPNSWTFLNCAIANNSAYGIQAVGLNAFTFIGGSIQYNGTITSGAGTYGIQMYETGYRGYGTVLFSGMVFEGNGGDGDVVSIQNEATSACNITFDAVSFTRTLNFVTVGYGTNQVKIAGVQPNSNYKFVNCNFIGRSGYSASAGRPAIANTNANARVEIDGSTTFWSATEAPATRDILAGYPGLHTGRVKFAGATSGAGTLTGPAVASSYVWTLPAATVTLAGLSLAQSWTANQSFDLAFFNSGVVGGILANSSLVISSTSHGSPSGDNVHIYGSTITHHGNNITVGGRAFTTVGMTGEPTERAINLGTDAAGNFTYLRSVWNGTSWVLHRQAAASFEWWADNGTGLASRMTLSGAGLLGVADLSVSAFASLGNSHTTSALKIGTFNHIIGRQSSDGSLLIGGGQASVIVNAANPLSVLSSLSVSGLSFFNLGVIGGTAANAVLTLSSTTSGAPSGDIVHIIGSTIRLRGGVTVGANIAPDSTLTINSNTVAAPTLGVFAGTVGLHLIGADATNHRMLFDSFSGSMTFGARAFGGTAAAPAATPAGTGILFLGAYGYTTVPTVASSALISLVSKSLWSGTNSDSYIDFATTPTGSTTRATGMRLQSSGGLAIGAAAIASDYGIGTLSVSGVGFFNSGIVGGPAANATFNIAATNHGSPSGDSLHLYGSSIVLHGNASVTGSLSKGSGTFLIDHPLDPEHKDLYHGFVEAPRYDLIYRGKVQLVNGVATVEIDDASNMMPGTFDALTQNAEVTALNNLSGFARVRSSAVIDGEFMITSEDPTSTDLIHWVVIAERADNFIIHSKGTKTDDIGRLIPEHNKFLN